MDELIGGLFTLMVIGFLIAAAIAIALAIVAAAASVGATLAAGEGVLAFVGSLSPRIAARGGDRRVPREPEPAFELYVLGQLRRDVEAALRDGWVALQAFRGRCSAFASGTSDNQFGTLLGVGAVIGGYVGTAVGAILAGVLALPVVLAAGILSAGAWVLVGILRAAEAVRRRVRRAHYECPEDHERFPLPVYVCPVCGAEHRQLVPGRWGILRRECRCGSAALPTMVLNGRQKVPQRCPSGHPMAGVIGFAENVRVAIVAGARAGKTTYLGAAVMMIEQLTVDGRFAINVVEQSRAAYAQTVDALRGGRLPHKTQLGTNPALVAEVQGEGRSRVLYAYDVAGESYATSDDARQLKFLEVPAALLLLVDPLAIPQVASDHAAELASDPDAVQVSPQDPMQVLERMIAALGEAGMESRKLPVAIVVAKVDAFGIGEEIDALESAQPGAGARAWLDTHGAGNLVRVAEQEFRHVGWFACSALGRAPRADDTRPFAPHGAAAPLLWLLERCGVAPAKQAFVPSGDSTRLAGAGVAAVAPIRRLGWLWRSTVAVVLALGLLSLMVGGIVVLVGGAVGGEDGTTAVASALASRRLASLPVKRDVRATLRGWAHATHAQEWCPLMSQSFRRRIYGGRSEQATITRCLADPNTGRRRRYDVLELRLAEGWRRATARVVVHPGGDLRRYRFVKSLGGWLVDDNDNR